MRAAEISARELDRSLAPQCVKVSESQLRCGSVTKGRLAGCYQPLDGSNLIGKATLNFLEPGRHREITAVTEKRLYVGHEQIGFIQEVVRFRQL
jgi:hypothetical protein